MKVFWLFLVCICSLVAATKSTLAEVIASSNFATLADGPLVGQGGWLQFGTSATNPLTVAGGSVSWTGGATVDNQDAILFFPSQITQPASSPFTVTFDMTLSVSSAPASAPSFFAALSTSPSTTTAGNFSNARLAVQSLNSGFVFGARVNGQGGYPFAFGTSELNFNQSYALRAEIVMNPGNANDTINLFVGNDFSSLALHSTAVYTAGTVTDPLFGGIIISQFGSGTVNQAGVSISSVSVSAIPEPGSMAMLAVAGVGGCLARRRMKKSKDESLAC